jgi:hypothetical protein
VAIGAQTERAVDDIAIGTEGGGWVTIQAKKGLQLSAQADGDLASALSQVALLARVGLPAGQGSSGATRDVDPDRDRVLIVSDETASRGISRHLRDVVHRLRTLPLNEAVEEAAKNSGERRALELLTRHLAHAWQVHHGRALSESDLRATCASLGVVALDLSDGGSHRIAAEQLLQGLLPSVADLSGVWKQLVDEGHQLSEQRTFLDRRAVVDALEPLLEEMGTSLSPAPRLRSDIEKLRKLTTINVDQMRGDRLISAPEAKVEVDRAVTAAVADATGNIAITGASGTGKTSELRRLADSLLCAGADVVVLRADDFHDAGGRVRRGTELTHDLADVLTGWPGRGEATLMIDGMDQTLGERVSPALVDLAHRLSGTRWRIVASVRTYNLTHDPELRRVFGGQPIDPALQDVRHVKVDDFDDLELAQVAAQSPQLASLLNSADRRLRSLLANPFNLNLMAQLLSTGELDLSTVRSRVDVLHQYWVARAYRHDTRRVAALSTLAEAMVDNRRQVAGVARMQGIDHAAIHSLCSDGVLRELPMCPGHAAPEVEFAHPVLFDYAVATLVLGDTSDPDSMADVLDHRPNLALTVQPSVELRLALMWRDDDSRAAFWRAGCRLVRRCDGHVLAALQAAHVAVSEVETDTDYAALADACAIPQDGSGGRTADARRLAFLVATLASRTRNPRALRAVAASARSIASSAERSSDPEAAVFAARVARRVIDIDTEPGLCHHWAAVATSCAELALANPRNGSSRMLAELAGSILAHVASVDAGAVTGVIERLSRPEVLHAWGIGHLHALVPHIADIARVAPDLAVTIGGCAWQASEAARHEVSRAFPALLQTDPMAATSLWLRAVEAPDLYPYPSSIQFDDPPRPRIGALLHFPDSNHHTLLMMTTAWITRLHELTESALPPGGQTDLAGIVERTVAELRHADVWAHLLHYAATAGGTALARLLQPALISPNLYMMPMTWIPAAHLACRLSPLLAPDDHATLERAILAIDRAGHHTAADNEFRDELRRRAGTILAALRPDRIQLEESRQAATDAAPLPALTDPGAQYAVTTRGLGDEAARHGPGRAPGDIQTTPTDIAQWLSIACQLLQGSALKPDTKVGADVYEALRSTLPVPTGHRSDWTEAHGDELRRLLAPYLDSPDPLHRATVTGSLALLLPDDIDVVDELARRLQTEPDHRVTAVLLHLLHRCIPNRGRDVDSVLAHLDGRWPWMAGGATAESRPAHDDVTGVISGILAVLATAYQTPFASARVRQWFAEPDSHHHQVHHALITLRDVLNPADASLHAAQTAAFELIETGARTCLASWQAQTANGATHPADAFGTPDPADTAAEMSGALLFSSGALDHLDPQGHPKRGAPDRFADLALPTLRVLAGLPHPSITRHVVQTCVFLASRQPIETLDIIANVLTANDEPYIRDAVALDIVIAMVRQYVVHHGDTLQDERCLANLRRVLEVFILTGWDSAIELARELRDVFE